MRGPPANPAKSLLTKERVLELLRYEPETGKFYWVNSRYSNRNGTEAGSLRKSGYVFLSIDGFQYLAHRVAWLVTHGEWPADGLDHRDGVRSHNWISNLRPADASQNLQNQRVAHKRGRSGLLGVSWSVSHKKWLATIMVDGKRHYLGRYASKDFAHAAYLQAKARLHPFQTIIPQGAGNEFAA